MAILITDKFQLRQRNFLDDRQGMASSIADLKFWDFLTVPIPEGFEVYVNGVWYIYKSTNEDDPATGKFRTRESGGLDIEAMWRELEADDETKQISSTHLSNALKKYLPLSGNSADNPMTGPIYLKFGNEDKSANIDDEYLSYRLKNGSATRDAQVSASYGFYYNYALGGSSSTRKYSQIIDDHITLYSLLDGTSSHTVHIFSDRISIDGNYVRHAGDTYYSNGSLVIGGVTVPISGEGIYLPLTAGRRYPLTGPLYITNDTGQYGSTKIYIDDENSGDFIIDVSDTFNDRLVIEGDDGILASKFIVPGGSTGFLKADGSIDNNSYFLKSGGTVGYQANKTTPLTVYGYMGSSYIQFESGSAILGKLGFETNTSTGTISPICVVGNTINTIRHSGDTYYESDNDRLVVGGVTVPLDSGPSTLSGLSDVLISNPLENNLLRYEIVNNVGVWRNFAPNYLTVYDIKHIQISHEVSDYKSVGQAKEEIIGYLNSQDYGIGDTLYVPASYINQWDDDSASYYASYAFSMIKIGGTSSGSSIGQWLLTSFGGNRIGYVGRSSNTWTPIRWLSTTEDLDNYLPLIGNSSSNPMIGNINFYDDCGISWENHKSYISADTDNDLWVNGHNNVLLSVGDGSSLGENIKVTVGSESVLVNNRLIIEDEFGRSTDINGGSIDAEVGISVDGNAVRHAGDTYYSNGILVVGGETVPTSEEPEQLSDLSDVSLVEPLNSNQLLRYEIVGNVGVWRNFTPNYITAFDVKHIQVSDSIPDNLTVGQAKTSIYNYTYNQNFGVGDTLVTPASYIYQWDDNSASYYSSDYFSMTKIGGAYWGSSGQWLLSSRGDTRIGYVGRYQGGSWTSIKWLSTTDDLNNYLPLTGNSRNNPITGDLYIAGDTNRFGPVKIWTDEDENGEFIIDLSETNDNRLIVKGTSEINGGLKVRGRYQNNGDAEGIVIGTADNGHAVLCLGNPKSERSVFYFSGDDVFWRYNNGTTSYDIEHPKQNGTIALKSDLLEYLPLTGGQMISDGTYNGQIYFPVDSGIVLDTDSYIKVLEDDSYLHINGYQAIILEIREDESSNPIEKVRISDEGLEMTMTEYLGTKLGTLLTDTTLKITGFPIFVQGSGGITPTTEVTAGRITINGYDVIHIGNWRNYIGNTVGNSVTYATNAVDSEHASYSDESNTSYIAQKLIDDVSSPVTDGLTASDIVNIVLNRVTLEGLQDTDISNPDNLNILMWSSTTRSWVNISRNDFITQYGLAKSDDLNKYLSKTAGWGEKVGGVLVLNNILALKDQHEDSSYVGLYNYENELNFIKNYGKSSSEYIRATVIDSTNWRNYIGNIRENQVTYATNAVDSEHASYSDESNTSYIAQKLIDDISSPVTDGLTASDIVNEALNRTSLSRLIDVSLSEPSNLNVLMWLTTANSWTNVSKDNFISLYGLARASDLNGYLPLTAGPNNSLTGDLYMGTSNLNMMTVGNVGTMLNHEKLEIKSVGTAGEQPNTTITAGSISINGVQIPYVIKIPTTTTSYNANNYNQDNTLYITDGDIVPRIVTRWNNFPVTVFSGGFSLVCITEGNYKRQLFSKYDSPFIWVRYQNYSSGGATWTDWQRMATLSDINLSDYLPLSGNSAANPMTGNISWGNGLNNGLYWDDNDISIVADADHYLVLTGLNGINLNSSYSHNTLMSVSDDYGTSIYGALGNGRTQIIKPVAELISSELYGYGYVVIELPQVEITGYYLVSLAMTIDIVNDSGNLISYDISGSLFYFNNNGDWSYPTVNCFIDAPLIRFGFNGTNFVIVIGKIGPTGTFWNSPTVVVRNVLITGGVSESTEGSDFAYNALCKNWTISFSKNVDNISFLSFGINVKNILVTNSDGDLDIGQHFIKFGNNRTWNVGYDSGITVLNSLSGDSSSTDGSPLKSYSSALHSAGLSVVGAAIGFQLAVTDDDYKLCYRAKKSSSNTYSDWKKLLDVDDINNLSSSYLPLSGNSSSSPMTGNISWGDGLGSGLYWDDNDISIVADADHYLVLTGLNGINLNSSYSHNTLMSVSDDYGTSVYGALGNGRSYLTKPVADFISYRDSSSYKDGCIAISLPSSVNGAMISMWIDVYDYAYAVGAAFSIHCGGHPFYSSSDRKYVWRGTFSVCYGSNQRVRFGHNGTNFVIYIGETDHRWSYSRVSVRDVLINYIPATNDDQYSILCNDWNISFSTSVQGVSIDNNKRRYVITNSDLEGYLPFTGGVMTKSGEYNGQIYFPADSGVVFDTDSYIKVLDDSYLHINGSESIIMEIYDPNYSNTPTESVKVIRNGLDLGDGAANSGKGLSWGSSASITRDDSNGFLILSENDTSIDFKIGSITKMSVDSSEIITSNNILLKDEKYIITKNPRKKAGGGGWAVSSLQMTGNDNISYFTIGSYGDNNVLNYTYFGVNAYNAENNLRIYSDSLKWGSYDIINSNTISNYLTSSYLPLSGNSAANPMTGNISWGSANNNGLYWDDNDISVVADADHYLVLTGFSGIDFRSSYSNSTLMSISDDYGLKMGKNQISRIILDDEFDDFDGLEIKLAARNFRITTGDRSTTLYINYDSLSLTNGTVPNVYRWHNGTSNGYASHHMGLVQATKFKLINGTSSQFLKADGSVDSNPYIILTNNFLSFTSKAGGSYTGWRRIMKWDLNNSNQWDSASFTLFITRNYNSPTPESYFVSVVWSWNERCSIKVLNCETLSQIIKKLRIGVDGTNHKLYLEMYVDTAYSTHQNDVYIRAFGDISSAESVEGSASSSETTYAETELKDSYVTTSVLSNYLPLSAGSGNVLTGDLYMGAQALNMRITTSGNTYGSYLHYNGLQLTGLPERLSDGTSYTPVTTVKAGSITTNGNITVGANSIIFNQATSSTWNVGRNAGLMILNTVGQASTGAPGNYEVGLSVVGYYGFQLSVHGGSQGGLKYRKIGSGDGYSDPNYDTSWKELANKSDLSSYLPLDGGTLTGALHITGSNSITGSASFNSALLVNNNVEIDGHLYVDNPTTINSTLSVDDKTSISGNVGIGTSASSTYKLVVQGGMSFFYGNIGVGTSPVNNYAIDVDGSARAASWVTNSDSRLKDIVDYDVCISSESVAVAPIVSFLWKNHHDRGIQVGSIAQYWQDLVPEAVHSDDNGYLSMQYDVIALLSAISVARKVQNHEERILELEQENKILREKISNLEKAS